MPTDTPALWPLAAYAVMVVAMVAAVVGLWGKPTIVNNVETICCVHHIALRGWEWFKSLSHTDEGGTKLYGVSGHVQRPGVWELPMGTTAREILEVHAGMRAGRAGAGLAPGPAPGHAAAAHRPLRPLLHGPHRGRGVRGDGVLVRLPPAREAEAVADCRGLAWRHPWQAAILTAMRLSLAGIPLTAGFIGKFYVLAAGVRSGLWLLVATLAVNSAIGLFYYLRVIAALFAAPEKADAAPAPGRALPRLSGAALPLLLLALLWLGLDPAPALRLPQGIAGP